MTQRSFTSFLGITIIALLMIAYTLSCAKSARAEDYYDCPSIAFEARDLAEIETFRVHDPHIFIWVEWLYKPDGAHVSGVGTDTLYVTGAHGGILQAVTMCVTSQVWIPLNLSGVSQ